MNANTTAATGRADERSRIPVTVVGGYLGAGKTTLVNHLLSTAHDQRIAVLVNDFGAINVDAALVRSRDADTIELANGCICCSLADGFVQAMQRIDERLPRVDRLVIETSGVADPGAVSQYAHLPGFDLEAVIVLADAETIRNRSADRYVGRQVIEQLRSADVIVLNKVDLVDGPTVASVRDFIAQLAPLIPVISAEQSSVPYAVLFAPSVDASRTGRAHAHALGQGHRSDPDRPTHRSWTMVGELAVERASLVSEITALPPSVVRGKGIVTFESDTRRWLLQKVGARTTCTPAPDLGPTDPDGLGSRLVFVGISTCRESSTDQDASTGQEASIAALAAGLGLRLLVREVLT